jgi:hypothetical protein
LKDAVKQTKGNTEPGFFAIALSNNLSKISATINKEVRIYNTIKPIQKRCQLDNSKFYIKKKKVM